MRYSTVGLLAVGVASLIWGTIWWSGSKQDARAVLPRSSDRLGDDGALEIPVSLQDVRKLDLGTNEPAQLDAAGIDQSPAAEAEAGPYSPMAFRLRYESFGRDELGATHAELKKELKRRKAEAYEQRLEAGFFLRFPFEYDENGALIPGDETFEIPDDWTSRFKKPFKDNVGKEWHLVNLPEDEYPELYGVLAEMRWVRDRKADLGRELTKPDPDRK